MEIIEMKTVTITEKGQIALPRSIRKNENFKEGSKLIVITFDDHVELRPIKKINKDMLVALASEKVLAKYWNTKGEDKAWKDL